MATTIKQMIQNTRAVERMTLAELRSLIQHSRVDTNLATAQAAQIELNFLASQSREVRIAVFLSGLMANLVGED
jgi:hypothetical protein